jgi:hypothetical protein
MGSTRTRVIFGFNIWFNKTAKVRGRFMSTKNFIRVIS